MTRFVIAVVVDAVKRQAWRAFAHVGEEVAKIIPPRADFDAAPTPIGVVFKPGVGAALTRAGPAFVSWRHFSIYAMPVLEVPRLDEFQVITTAGACSAPPKAIAGGDDLIAAIADTAPVGATLAGVHKFKHDKSPKTLTSEVFQRHGISSSCHPRLV
jgi:hypothetical protein